jgi:hypothetical protein
VAAIHRHGCQPVVGVAGYVNPLRHTRLTGERIDQGVDYAGTGLLGALGRARVTRVDTADTGWPGAFIEYRLLDGADAGCYVYYAEGVTPVQGLHAGQVVTPGQRLASIVPGWSTGIEIGWGSGANATTLAAKTREWTAHDDAADIPSAAGRSFSSLVRALGGPPGKDES